MIISAAAAAVILIAIQLLGVTVGLSLELPGLKSFSKKGNVILMISDGFGPASETFSRSVTNFLASSSSETKSSNHSNILMELDSILVGSSRTRSSSSLVTDSAAGATAFSCAMKTFNRGIGVDPKGIPCGTVLEAAKAKGYKTGLIVTSRITHATPAAFSAHVIERDMEALIAKHQCGLLSDKVDVDPAVDVMLGGGKSFYLPKSDPQSARTDDLNLLELMHKKFHYEILENRTALLKFPKDKKVLGLFDVDHLPFYIDRNLKEEDNGITKADVPSLVEMTSVGLETLEIMCSQDPNCPGYFVMIEGSRIDMAAHLNDAGTHYWEIMEYQKTVKLVKDLVSKNPLQNTLISTSDHETGGLSLARQLDPSVYPEPYKWNPEPLTKQRRSVEYLARSIVHNPEKYRNNATNLALEIIEKSLGIPMEKADLSEFLELSRKVQKSDFISIQSHLADMISRRCELGWSSHGHSGVDVNLYAYGKDSNRLRGSRENTEIGDFIVSLLDLDLPSITHDLGLNDIKTSEKVAGEEFVNFKVSHYHHHHH